MIGWASRLNGDHQLGKTLFFWIFKVEKCTWQPLGPLLKVILLVGYISAVMSRCGTGEFRATDCVPEPQQKHSPESESYAVDS